MLMEIFYVKWNQLKEIKSSMKTGYVKVVKNTPGTQELTGNHTALRKAKIVCNFGLSECIRVKILLNNRYIF